MESCEKDQLRSHQVDLEKDLEPRDILEHLYGDGVITENDVELLSSKPTRRERTQTLLALLPRRGPTAYGSFKRALEESCYTHLAELLVLSSDTTTRSDAAIGTEIEAGTCTCLNFMEDNLEAGAPLLDFIKRHCCLVFNNVEPRDVTGYLYQNNILSQEDLERIHSGVTRHDRSQYLIATLLNTNYNHDQVISTFARSLKSKYMFLVNKMELENDDQEPRYSQVSKDSRPAEESDAAMVLAPLNPVSFSPELLPIRCVDQEQDKESSKALPSVTIMMNPGSIKPFSLPKRKLELAFNHLSSLINQGQYDTFERASGRLQFKFSGNADMSCLLAYLNASRWLYGNKMEEAKRQIKHGFQLVPETSNPKYFTVELFTAKTRMYITQKKLNKLESALDDVKQVIETDPVGCTGRAAGWLYMNDGRGKTAQMTLLNLKGSTGLKAYTVLFQAAKSSLLKALDNFTEDGGKDGPFGCGYALCRLAILLLRCGDNGSTMETLVPPPDDVEAAGMYIQRLEESSIPIPKILEVHLLIAKCDYYYRKDNITRGLEKAIAASKLAENINMMEFKDHAQNRVQYLTFKAKQTMVGAAETDHLKIMQELLSESDIEM